MHFEGRKCFWVEHTIWKNSLLAMDKCLICWNSTFQTEVMDNWTWQNYCCGINTLTRTHTHTYSGKVFLKCGQLMIDHHIPNREREREGVIFGELINSSYMHNIIFICVIPMIAVVQYIDTQYCHVLFNALCFYTFLFHNIWDDVLY